MRKSKSTSTVQKKGQVTLPMEIRQELGIKPGDSVVFELAGEGVLIKSEKIERLDRLNQLLVEMNQILREEEERGESLSLEEMIEGVREEREKILKEKNGLDAQDVQGLDDDERRRLEALDQAHALRTRLAAQGRQTDSVSALDEVREGRMDELSSLR